MLRKWRIKRLKKENQPQVADIAFSVFSKIDCKVAMVYSSASARFGFVAEWAKNSAAKTSPTPVKTTLLSPIIGIDIVYRSFVLPVKKIEQKGKSWEKKSFSLMEFDSPLPSRRLRNPINSVRDAKLADEMTTVLTPFSWNHSTASHASSGVLIFLPVNISASNWFGVQMSHNGRISFW